MQRLINRLLLWGVTRPARAAVLFALITIALAGQIPRLQIDASNEGFMLEQDPERQYYERVKGIFGSDELTVVTGRENGIADPKVLEQIADLQQFLESIPGIGNTTSIVDYVSHLNATLTGTNNARRAVPPSADGVSQDLLLMDRAEVSRFLDLPTAAMLFLTSARTLDRASTGNIDPWLS